MGKINIREIKTYIGQNIGSFHSKRLQSLESLKFSKILSRKNPYLFKAKNILKAQDLVQMLLDAYLSSQEETIFGDFLEDVAIFINEKIYNGRKSSAVGIDLEFDRDDIHFIVSIKSGPHWGNSRQISKMKDDFSKAKRILRTSNSKIHIVAINGCCYGRDSKPDKGEYFKYCGQQFWEFISGNESLFIDIIEPLGLKAKEKNEEFLELYSQIVNKFTYTFTHHFCTPRGSINWDILLEFNSSKISPNRKLTTALNKNIVD